MARLSIENLGAAKQTQKIKIPKLPANHPLAEYVGCQKAFYMDGKKCFVRGICSHPKNIGKCFVIKDGGKPEMLLVTDVIQAIETFAACATIVASGSQRTRMPKRPRQACCVSHI